MAPKVRGEITPTIIISIGKNRPHMCFLSLPKATAAAMVCTNKEEKSPNRKQFSHISIISTIVKAGPPRKNFIDTRINP